jgi:hypothetical protein
MKNLVSQIEIVKTEADLSNKHAKNLEKEILELKELNIELMENPAKSDTIDVQRIESQLNQLTEVVRVKEIEIEEKNQEMIKYIKEKDQDVQDQTLQMNTIAELQKTIESLRLEIQELNQNEGTRTPPDGLYQGDGYNASQRGASPPG